MFINSIFEFCIGYLCNIDVLLIESSLSLLVLGSYIDNEFGIGDLGEFLSNDRGDVRGYQIQSDLSSIVGSILVDNISSGLVSDGVCSLVYVGVSLVSSFVSVFSNYCSYLVSGLDSCGVVSGGNNLMSLLLIPFECVSVIMRSLSMGIRVFSNLVSGVLLSSIFMPLSVIGLVGSLSSSSVVLGIVSCSLLLVSVIGLVGLESFVGVVQNFVFVVLGSNYSVDVRGSDSSSIRGSNRYIMGLLLPLICVGESSGNGSVGIIGVVLLVCSLGIGIYCGRSIVGEVSRIIDRSSGNSYNLVEDIISRNPGLRNIPVVESSSLFDRIDSVVSNPFFLIGLGVVILVGGLILSGVVYNVSVGSSSSRISIVENDSIQNVCSNGIGYIYNLYRDSVDYVSSSCGSICSSDFISLCSIVGGFGLFIGLSFCFMFRDQLFLYDCDSLQSLINGQPIIGVGCDMRRLSNIGSEFFRGCSYVSYSNFGSRLDILFEICRLLGPCLPYLRGMIQYSGICYSNGYCNMSVFIHELLNIRVRNNGLISFEESNLIMGIDQILRNRRGYRPVGYGSYCSRFDLFGYIQNSRSDYIGFRRGLYLNDGRNICELPMFNCNIEEGGVDISQVSYFSQYFDMQSGLRERMRSFRRNQNVLDLPVEYNVESRPDMEMGVLVRNSGDVRLSSSLNEDGLRIYQVRSIGDRSYLDLFSDLEQQLSGGRYCSPFIRSGYRNLVLDLRRNNRSDYLNYICGIDGYNYSYNFSDSSLYGDMNYSFFGELLGSVCTVKTFPHYVGNILTLLTSKTSPTTKVPYASRFSVWWVNTLVGCNGLAKENLSGLDFTPRQASMAE